MKATHITLCAVLAFSFVFIIYWLSGGNFDRDWRLGFTTVMGIVTGLCLYNYQPFENLVDQVVDEAVEEALAELKRDGELK
jgi:hypothetical protein